MVPQNTLLIVMIVIKMIEFSLTTNMRRNSANNDIEYSREKGGTTFYSGILNDGKKGLQELQVPSSAPCVPVKGGM